MKKTVRQRLALLATVATLLAIVAACGRTTEVAEVTIVPEPLFVNKHSGTFTLTNNPAIYLSGLGQNSQTARYIARDMRHAHFHPSFVGKPMSGCITIGLNDTINPELGDEGYLLEVRSNGVAISANTETGLFYGYQSFVQLLPPDVRTDNYRRVVIPECTVLDKPRFAWRGAHLDACTHFFSTKFVKDYIDIASRLKINKLQILLANDYGYRLPSEYYPELNATGSWRPQRKGAEWEAIVPATADERSNYGGYYNVREIVDLVAYAAERHVELIPELSLPSGASALLASYPEWGCRPDSAYAVQVGPCWPRHNVLCLGADSALSTLEHIVDEVVALFPSAYINLGLDHAATDVWERCPKCQAAMRRQHLHSEDQLQNLLAAKLDSLLANKGKIMMGRDIDLALAGSSTVLQCQSGIKDCQAFAYRSGFVVLSPDEYSFDTYQADPRYHPSAAPRQLTLRQVYNYDLVPQGTNSHVVAHLLGAQCSLPTERITTPHEAERQLLPRLMAMAENLWTPASGRNWARFRRNVAKCKTRFETMGYSCYEGWFKPLFRAHNVGNGQFDVSLETEIPNTYIFYTLDGSDPTELSPIYLGPIRLASGTHIKTLAYHTGEPREGIYEFVIGK